MVKKLIELEEIQRSIPNKDCWLVNYGELTKELKNWKRYLKRKKSSFALNNAINSGIVNWIDNFIKEDKVDK